MNKKSIFTIFFIIFSIAICTLIANEYLKRVEKNAIEVYLASIKNEFLEYTLKVDINPVVCSGFIKHNCNIDNIKIYNKNIEIKLKDIYIAITNISSNDIGVVFSINKIEKTSYVNPYLKLIPSKFTYKLNLLKKDSRLGYIMLNRSINLSFDNINMDINLDMLLREKKFSNKNILFLLKEWFDSSTPSFYEYSLDNLKLSIQENKTIKTGRLNQSNDNLKKLIQHLKLNSFKEEDFFQNKIIIKHVNDLVESLYELLEGKIKSINLKITRKNEDLVFFNLLTNEAMIKKFLEIQQILNSINETYNIKLKI